MPRRRRRTPTPAEIWRILHATARESKIARRELAELAREFQRAEEVRRQAEEARRRAEETRQQELAERDRKLKDRINHFVGAGDNRWGELMEAMVEGNLLSVLGEARIPVDYVAARLHTQRDGVWREYDLVAVGDRDAVVVETKTTLRESDIRQFQERIADFRSWRPNEARPKLWGAFAYLTARGEAARSAEEAGFYLIRAVSGSARLVNSARFRPHRF